MPTARGKGQGLGQQRSQGRKERERDRGTCDIALTIGQVAGVCLIGSIRHLHFLSMHPSILRYASISIYASG